MDFESGGAAALIGGEGGGNGGQGGGSGGADGVGGDGAAAAAAANGEGGGEGVQGAVDPDWYASLADKPGEGETAANRDWVRTKGFKDLDGMVKSARDTEKALRDSGRVKVPGEGASDEDIAAFRKAIGVPDEAKGYEVKLPETNGGLELDAEVIGQLSEIAFKAGVPKAGFEAIANAYVASQVEAHLANVQKQDGERDAKLKEWGGEKDAKIAQLQSAARALKLERNEVAALQSALGSGRVMDILSRIGGGMAEDVLATGGTGRFGITAAEAKTEMDAIKADATKSAAVLVKGSPEQARWNRLLEILGEDAEEKARAS